MDDGKELGVVISVSHAPKDVEGESGGCIGAAGVGAAGNAGWTDRWWSCFSAPPAPPFRFPLCTSCSVACKVEEESHSHANDSIRRSWLGRAWGSRKLLLDVGHPGSPAVVPSPLQPDTVLDQPAKEG